MIGLLVHSHTQAKKQDEEILEHSRTLALRVLTGRRLLPLPFFKGFFQGFLSRVFMLYCPSLFA